MKPISTQGKNISKFGIGEEDNKEIDDTTYQCN